MKTLLSVLAIYIAFAVQVFGANINTPLALPIGSRGALKAYALEQVSAGYISLSSSSQIQKSGDLTYFQTKGSPGDITRQFSEVVFRFHVYNTSDPVYLNAGLHDDSWNVYFYGYTKGKVETTGSDTFLSAPNLTLRLVDQVPIKVEGASYAQITFRDSQGNVYLTDYLQVNNGVIFFPQSYVETNQKGEIRIGINNNGVFEEHVLSLQGEELPTTSVSGYINNTTIDNAIEITDSGYPIKTPLWASGSSLITDPSQSSPPVIRVELKQSRAIQVAWYLYYQGVWQTPSAVWYYKKGSEFENPLTITNLGTSMTPVLDPGIYYFYFEYPLFESPAPTQPVNGWNGKG